MGVGLRWSLSFPINKNLWTSSYAVFMSGLAALLLVLCIVIVDGKGWRGWARPFEWLGRNAIAAFVLSTLGTILILGIKLRGPDGKPRSLYATIYRTVFDRFADPRLGSLLFALAYLAIWIGVCWVLYRKSLFLYVLARDGVTRPVARREEGSLDSSYPAGAFSLIIANPAPSGSVSIAKRPTFSMSVGGTITFAPRLVAVATALSQSSTAK